MIFSCQENIKEMKNQQREKIRIQAVNQSKKYEQLVEEL